MLSRLMPNEPAMLEEDALIWACIGPVMEPLRGKEPAIKARVYEQLNPGRRALFMVQVLKGHAGHGVVALLNQLDYLLGPATWRELKSGYAYFGAHGMVQLLEDLERLHARLQGTDTQAEERAEAVRAADQALKLLLPEAVRLVADYIRSHPDEFMQV